MTIESAVRETGSERASFFWLILGALLTAFANGQWTLALAAWLAPVFLLRFVRRQKLVRGFLLGVVAVTLASVFPWQGVIPLPPLVYYVVIFFISLFGFLPYLVDRLLAPRLRGFAATLVLPLAWTSYEYVGSLTNPYGSWGSVAYTQSGNLALLQLVSVTGLWGVTFLLTWLAAVVNWAWESRFDWTRVRRGVLVYAAVLVLVILGGGARLAFFAPQSETVRVAAVAAAPDGTFSALKRDLLRYLRRYRRGEEGLAADRALLRSAMASVHEGLLERSRRAARAGARIVFWAENSGLVFAEDEGALLARGRALAQEEKIYLGLGLGTVKPDGRPPIEDKVVLLNPSGKPAWEFFKARPIPGEPVVAGDGRIPLLPTPHGHLATVICFDLDFPHLLQQPSVVEADLLFAPSGDWPEAAALHAQMAVFRAVEHGFSLVRPTNRGLSLAADPQGRTLARLDYFHTSDPLMIVDVPAKGAATFYSRWGDWFAWACLAGLVSLAGFALLWRKATSAS